MNNSMKAIYGSSKKHPGDYKLELWTVSPEGKGMKVESSIMNNQRLLSIFNTHISNGRISQDDLSDFELEAIKNNQELAETTLFLHYLWRSLLPNGRIHTKRQSFLWKVYANTRRTQKPHSTTEIREITRWCAWLAHRSKNLYKSLLTMQKERIPQLWAKTFYISTIHGDMCCLWRTIRRFVKSNYPMNNKSRQERINEISVTERMMYPTKLAQDSILIFDDNEPIISTKKRFENILNAWWFSRRYDSKMPYIGEFIGEWLNRYYPMRMPLNEQMMHVSIARGNKNTSSISQVITEYAQMIEIEPSIDTDEISPKEVIENYFQKFHLCIHCSGMLEPSCFANHKKLMSCKCYELDENPYWTKTTQWYAIKED